MWFFLYQIVDYFFYFKNFSFKPEFWYWPGSLQNLLVLNRFWQFNSNLAFRATRKAGIGKMGKSFEWPVGFQNTDRA